MNLSSSPSHSQITTMDMAPTGDNVVVSNMKLERMLSMKGGNGEASYVNNSQAQVSYTLLSHFTPRNTLFS